MTHSDRRERIPYGLPLAPPILKDIEEYSDSYLSVQDTRRAKEKVGCFGGRRRAVTGYRDR